jgi:hypothetical protein
MWPAGTFWSAYSSNRDEAVEGVIEADPIAAAVRALMAKRTEWTGTASILLAALAHEVDERVANSKTWPDSPRALAGRLRRAATFLRKISIEISFTKEGRARTRTICITTTGSQSEPENTGTQRSAPSAPSAPISKSNSDNGFDPADVRTVANDADDDRAALVPTVRYNPLETDAGTIADGADANSRPQSDPEKAKSASWSAQTGAASQPSDDLEIQGFLDRCPQTEFRPGTLCTEDDIAFIESGGLK